MISNTNPQSERDGIPNMAEELDIRLNKDAAALSYLPPLALILFFVKRHSTFVRFHSRQAMVLLALAVLFWFIPYAGKFLELLVLLGMSIGFASAAAGKRFELLVIGALSHGKIFRAIRELIHGIIEIRHLPTYISLLLSSKKPETVKDIVDTSVKATPLPLANTESNSMLSPTSSSTLP